MAVHEGGHWARDPLGSDLTHPGIVNHCGHTPCQQPENNSSAAVTAQPRSAFSRAGSPGRGCNSSESPLARNTASCPALGKLGLKAMNIPRGDGAERGQEGTPARSHPSRRPGHAPSPGPAPPGLTPPLSPPLLPPLVAARFRAPAPPPAAASAKSREIRAVRRARAAPCRMPLGAAGAPPRPAAPAPRTEPGSASRPRSAPGPCPCSSLRSSRPRPPGHAPLPLPFLRTSGGAPAAGPGAEPGVGMQPPEPQPEPSPQRSTVRGGGGEGEGWGVDLGAGRPAPLPGVAEGGSGDTPRSPHPAGLGVSPSPCGSGLQPSRGTRTGCPGSRGCPALRGPGCGDGRRLVLILAPVLLPHSHAPSRENFGLCFWSPWRSEAGGLPGDPRAGVPSAGAVVSAEPLMLLLLRKNKLINEKQMDSQVKAAAVPWTWLQRDAAAAVPWL